MKKFNPKIPLGKWFGIPVILHWSWVALFLFVLWSSPAFAMVYAGVFVLVLMHEFGHAMAGRYFKFPTESITLYPFGGMARMDIPVDPKQECLVAIAGPAVNAILFPVFLALQQYEFCVLLGYYNVVLLIFNLVPALPMDGGRVLRSMLTITMHDRHKATIISARISQCICVGFAILGMIFGLYMLVVIAFFIFMAAQSEIEHSKICKVASFSSGRPITDSAEAMRVIQMRLANIRERYRDPLEEINNEE